MIKIIILRKQNSECDCSLILTVIMVMSTVCDKKN
jgi:hypothetical protein